MKGMPLIIAGRTFRSRLMIGTGKYRSFPEMARCHAASGAEVVTVAGRRVNLTDRSTNHATARSNDERAGRGPLVRDQEKESMLDYIDRERMLILPNTAGCY